MKRETIKELIQELEVLRNCYAELEQQADAAGKAVNKEGKPYTGNEYFKGKATAYAGAVAVITRRIERLKTKLEEPFNTYCETCIYVERVTDNECYCTYNPDCRIRVNNNDYCPNGSHWEE